jgi:hypothetical protein
MQKNNQTEIEQIKKQQHYNHSRAGSKILMIQLSPKKLSNCFSATSTIHKQRLESRCPYNGIQSAMLLMVLP